MFNAFPFHDSERGTQTEPTPTCESRGLRTGHGAVGNIAVAPVIHYIMDPDRAQIIENCKILFPASSPSIITRCYDSTIQALVINSNRSHFLPVDSAGVEASGLLLAHTTKKSAGANVIRGLLQKSQVLLNVRLREHSSRSLAAEEEVSRILNSETWARFPESVKSKAGGIILRRLWDEMVEAEKAKEKKEIEDCLRAFEEERGKVRERMELEEEKTQQVEREQMILRQRRLEDELRRCQRDYVQRFGDRGRARDIASLLGEDPPVSPTSSCLDRRNAVNGHHHDNKAETPTSHGASANGHVNGHGNGSGGGGTSTEIGLLSPRSYPPSEPISRSGSPRPPTAGGFAGELQLMRLGNGSYSGSSNGMQTPPYTGPRGVTLRD